MTGSDQHYRYALMTADYAPVLIGLLAAGLALALIGLALATWPLEIRIRLWAEDHDVRSKVPFMTREHVHRPGVEGNTGVVARPSVEHDTETVAVHLREAKKLIARAERQSDSLLRGSAEEAERITEIARQQAQDMLAAAQVEAKAIVDGARQERLRLIGDVQRERAVLEETRTRLSGFLTGALDEVGSVPAAAGMPENVRDIGDARASGRRSRGGSGPVG